MKHFRVIQNGKEVASFFCEKYNFDKDGNSYVFQLTEQDSLIVSNMGTIIKIGSAETEMERLNNIAEHTMKQYEKS
jgi:hypothetical protein